MTDVKGECVEVLSVATISHNDTVKVSIEMSAEAFVDLVFEHGFRVSPGAWSHMSPALYVSRRWADA